MRSFLREVAPFVRRHPAFVFASIFCPYFIVANAVLAAVGIPKQPHDIAVILLRVLVTCGLIEIGLACYRRATQTAMSE